MATPDGNKTAAIVIVVVILIVIFVVALAVTYQQQRRSPSEGNGSTNEHFSLLNSTGQELDCATMDRHIMRSTPACGLNLPQMTMGRLCVDDACLNAHDVNSLVNLSSNLQDQSSALKAEFDQLHERLDTMSESRKARFSRLGEQISGVKGMVRSIGQSRSQWGGYVGMFRISNPGTLSVSTPGIRPAMVKFYCFGTNDSTDQNRSSRSIPKGLSVGHANREDGTQQCIQNGMSGRSMNTAARFASNRHCIGFRYQGGNNKRGLLSASLSDWSSRGFELNVDSFHRDTYCIVEAYGESMGSSNEGGLATQTGVMHLTSEGIKSINVGFNPEGVLFRLVPHFKSFSMDSRTSGHRWNSIHDNQNGMAVGFARKSGSEQQSFSNTSHGSSTNQTYHYASSDDCIAYTYPNTNGNVRGRTRVSLEKWGSNSIRFNVRELAEPVYVLYTAYGRHRSQSQRVYMGSTMVTGSGAVSTPRMSLRPSYAVFDMRAHIVRNSMNSESGDNEQDFPSVHGNSVGYASRDDGKQVAVANSSSGSSTNRSAMFAQRGAVALMKYVDRSAREIDDNSKTVIRVSDWDSNSLSLEADQLAGYNPHLLLYTVFGDTSSAGSELDVIDALRQQTPDFETRGEWSSSRYGLWDNSEHPGGVYIEADLVGVPETYSGMDYYTIWMTGAGVHGSFCGIWNIDGVWQLVYMHGMNNKILVVHRDVRNIPGFLASGSGKIGVLVRMQDKSSSDNFNRVDLFWNDVHLGSTEGDSGSSRIGGPGGSPAQAFLLKDRSASKANSNFANPSLSKNWPDSSSSNAIRVWSDIHNRHDVPTVEIRRDGSINPSTLDH